MLRLSKMIKCISNASNISAIRTNNNNKLSQYVQDSFLQLQVISFATNCTNNFEDIGIEDEKKQRKKTQRIPKITLIHVDQSQSVLFLEEAQKIAKKQNLKLMLVEENDPKSDRSIYKLVDSIDIVNNITDGTGETIRNTSKNSKEKINNFFKRTKLFAMKSTTTEHDLNIKINNINKLLKKRHKVKILINHPNEDQERTLATLKTKVEGSISSQKIKKDNTILVFSPVEDVSNTSENNTSS